MEQLSLPSELSKDAIQILQFLMPGLLAAWVFYGLTSHPKPSQFERIVQALIFTFIVQPIVPVIRWVMLWLGRHVVSLGYWSGAVQEFTTVVTALSFGLLVAFLTNNNFVHAPLSRLKLTSRSSYPSEWYYVLETKVMWVILQLKDGRRIYGWPDRWPVARDSGQFYLTYPAWIKEDGKAEDLKELDGVLIDASDVNWAEFRKIENQNNDQPSSTANNQDP